MPAVLTELNLVSTIMRIVLAGIIGGLIGIEREKHGRAAGLRTHILVSVGSALAMLVGIYAADYLKLDADPVRIAAQVISGIGFLGAGTILIRRSTHITGLTTAASLWATASVGLAVGIGFYTAALTAALVAIVSVSVLSRFEKKRGRVYYVELDEPRALNTFFDAFSTKEYHKRIVPAQSGAEGFVGVELECVSQDCDAFLRSLREMEHVVVAISVSE